MDTRPSPGTSSTSNGSASGQAIHTARPRVRLLGRFELQPPRCTRFLGANARRLVVVLAIWEGPASRASVASRLWPDASSARASANLRSSLWRLQRAGVDAVEVSQSELRLVPGMTVDLREAVELARRLLDRSLPMTHQQLGAALRCNLRDDLLPGWHEEWLVAEQERFRQLRLHALEALSDRLRHAGWYGAAVDAGLAAVDGDPLRESAHQVVIKTHLAEGNHREAVRQYQSCRQVLRDELGLDPSPRLHQLLQAAGVPL